jgi:ABC-type multidrug transport system fused ATPase/permease subunit
MTTIQRCNRIAVIEDGVISEDGSYDALVNQEGGSFNKLARGKTLKKA